MKSRGPNPNSIWNMIPETAEETEWLAKAQHALTCHEFGQCDTCRSMRGTFDWNRYHGKTTLVGESAEGALVDPRLEVCRG